MEIEWKPAYGYEGWYNISNLGQIKRIKPAKGVVVGTAVRSYQRSPTGVVRACLSKDRQQVWVRVADLVFESFIARLDYGQFISFRDENPSNVCLDNLYVSSANDSLPGEEWKVMYKNNSYAVSSLSRVRVTKLVSKKSCVGAIIKSTPGRHGYLSVHLWQDGKRIKKLVHRIVAETFIGPAPSKKHEVRHLDGNNQNNIPTNLAWGSKKDNAEDKIRHGRQPRGAYSVRSKLSWDDAEFIRTQPTYKGLYAFLWSQYPYVSRSTFDKIRSCKTYKKEWESC